MNANRLRSGNKREIYVLADRDGSSEYSDFVKGLQRKAQEKIATRIVYLSEADLPITNPDISRKLTDEIYELKVRTTNLFIRILYFFYKRDVVITLSRATLFPSTGVG